ncbi:MAG: autotransporter outer membrane beta-barrel domain-containing protein [Alphaproteobacteria bacterium]|nr:autotransporter outer membrane beta-barrel domain-containing protein [Alphaproteobacteria bacterium]
MTKSLMQAQNMPALGALAGLTPAQKYDFGKNQAIGAPALLPIVPSAYQTAMVQQQLSILLRGTSFVNQLTAKPSKVNNDGFDVTKCSNPQNFVAPSTESVNSDRSFDISAQPFYTSTNMSTHGQTLGMHGTTQGVMINPQYKISDDYSVGLIAMGTSSDYSMRQNQSDGKIKSGSLGIQGDYMLPFGLHVNGAFLLGKNHFDSKRSIFVPTLSPFVATQSHKGLDTTGVIGAGATIPLTQHVFLSPYFNLSYTRSHQDAYTETGAPGFNVNSKARDSDTLGTVAGASLVNIAHINNDIVSTSFSLTYYRDQSLRRKNTATLSFVGPNSQSFGIPCPSPKHNQLAADVSVVMFKKGGVYFGADLGGRADRQTQSVQGTLKAGYRF